MQPAFEGGAFAFDMLLAAVVGNQALAERVARECLKLMPSLQARMAQALSDSNRQALAAAAHQLRGMAANMGAKQLSLVAATLETGAGGDSFENLAQVHAQTLEAWRVVEAVLNAQVG